MVKGAPVLPLYDATTKKVFATNYSATNGGQLGPYQVASFNNPTCDNSIVLSNMADPTRVQSILTATTVRVGSDVGCLTDPNFKGICNAPLQSNTGYRFKYLFMDINNAVISETDWSPPIVTVNGNPSSTIDTWPGRRSGGMIVLTSILSTLVFIILFAYVVGFIFSIVNETPATEVQRHDTQSVPVLPKPQEIGDVTFSSALTGQERERYVAKQQA
ncbi:hypothetical protein GDO86_004979 [Hymenochirus boettgeri]|nr:hypothetical protein GDO86_004979 [Hymenochirus boettgeri]